MLVSLTAALVAALFYGIASVMQSVAVHEASNRKPQDADAGGVDPGLLPRMLRQWRFVVSLCLDALGFVAQLIALQRLPLFAVQAIVAANLAVIAVVASLVIKVRAVLAGMARRDRGRRRGRAARISAPGRRAPARQAWCSSSRSSSRSRRSG